MPTKRKSFRSKLFFRSAIGLERLRVASVSASSAAWLFVICGVAIASSAPTVVLDKHITAIKRQWLGCNAYSAENLNRDYCDFYGRPVVASNDRAEPQSCL